MAIDFNAPSQVRPYANLGAFPATGAVKTIYIAEDTNYIYRWNGTAYIEISVADLVGYVPYTGATQDVNLGAYDAYVSKLWLYDSVNDNYGSVHFTDTDFHIEDADGHKMLVIEDGFMQIHKTDTIQSNLYTSGLTATRDHYLPDASGTIALTSDIPSLAGYVPTTRTITTTSPLSGGGDLSANRTLSIATANTTTTGALSSTDWNTFNGKQSALVSGTNIKTINSTSLLGSGDVAVQATLVSGTNIKTVNGTTILGSGDLTISTGITIGTTAITSGTVGRVLFEGTGNVVQESANLFWDNTNGRLGIGTTTPTGPLEVNGNIRSTTMTAVTSLSTGTVNTNIVATNGSNMTFIGSGTAGMVLFQATRNIVIQNGGTFTDAGFRLDVVGGDARINNLRIGLGAGQITSNLVVGNVALSANTTGRENVAIGTASMTSNTVGIRSIGIGDTSLFSNISGSSNVAIGMSSQRNATNADFNVSVGFATLNNNVSGSGNVAIGYQSGRFISGGSTVATSITNSVFIGANTYPLADTQTNQIVIGFSSVGLGSNTTVLGNTSIVSTAISGSVSIATGSQSAAVASAQLQVDSTTKGFLPPRQTQAQRTAIASPAVGLQVYQTDGAEGLYIYKSAGWALLL